jgi:DNA-binding CsgD family transcriptional regulator
VWDEAAGGFRPFAETADEATLTPREEEIYALLRAGCADKEIAHRLGRSIHTVRVHIRAVMRKRRVNRRARRVAAG